MTAGIILNLGEDTSTTIPRLPVPGESSSTVLYDAFFEAAIYAPRAERAGVYFSGHPVTARTRKMIATAQVYENTDITLLARFANADGTVLDRSTVESIGIYVYDITQGEPDEFLHSEAPVVNDTLAEVFTTSDARWAADTSGFNFEHRINDPALLVGGHRYRIEAILQRTAANGGPIHQVWEVTVEPIHIP